VRFALGQYLASAFFRGKPPSQMAKPDKPAP
jgi:hypothetical protein